jgi:hypothetical protein
MRYTDAASYTLLLPSAAQRMLALADGDAIVDVLEELLGRL